eukprot:TRINITY_DN72112_c0_g1_i1.p1 TRINITY_DN72112_c0_g1~~TRINITY_DN72112_c0_g1_i1.p1  ORF type:complete len:783 (+),score=227.59 TRINITY_DN72112_c0_g1_i1:91-2439(+)
MNSRAVSLPDLASERKRNTALSLSEGFNGATREATLSASKFNFPRRPTGKLEDWSGDDGSIPSKLNGVLPIYYRTRQIVLQMEKAGRRVPVKMVSELKAQERAVCDELKPLHPLLFQRFDSFQLDRLLRMMPILKCSQGRWVFGNEDLAEEWPGGDGARTFLLLYGKVALFSDASGAGNRWEVTRGALFGEKRFRICEEGLLDHICGAAYCEEPCVIGCMTSKVMEVVFADRAYGNARIAQMSRTLPAFKRIVEEEKLPEENVKEEKPKRGTKKEDEQVTASNAVATALRELSKIAAPIYVAPGAEVLMAEPLEETLLIVANGGMEVRGDVQLTERVDLIPPKKVRLRVYLEKAENLAGDSWLDKLDPYCIVKLGEYKRFQTPVLWNVGPNPKFDYNGCLQYKDEKELEITVMDHDKYSADDLCGTGVLKLDEVHDGWKGKVQLYAPASGMFKSDDAEDEEAGKVYVTIKYDYEKVTAATKVPKQRSWENLPLFQLKLHDVWGSEQIMMGHMFKKTLENCSNQLTYQVALDNFRLYGAITRGAQETCVFWKVSKRKFQEFVKHCGREKPFVQACRVSSLEKQNQVKVVAERMIQKWQQEEMASLLRSGALMAGEPQEEAMDPSRFRVAYKGTKAMISVRNALNLPDGSLWDKLDPYAKLRFKGGKAVMQTSVLQDAGSDPVWDCEGTLLYQGETELEIEVWDYDTVGAGDLVAVAKLQVEQFCAGFEGMIPLNLPGGRKKKSVKPMMIIIGIQWGAPRDPSALRDQTMSEATTTKRLMGSTM